METAGYMSHTQDPAGHRDRRTPGRNPAAHPPTGRHKSASSHQGENRRPATPKGYALNSQRAHIDTWTGV